MHCELSANRNSIMDNFMQMPKQFVLMKFLLLLLSITHYVCLGYLVTIVENYLDRKCTPLKTDVFFESSTFTLVPSISTLLIV